MALNLILISSFIHIIQGNVKTLLFRIDILNADCALGACVPVNNVNDHEIAVIANNDCFIVAVGIGLNRASIFSPFPFDFAGCATCAIQGNVFFASVRYHKPVKIDFIGVVLTHKVFKHKAQRGVHIFFGVDYTDALHPIAVFCGLGKMAQSFHAVCFLWQWLAEYIFKACVVTKNFMYLKRLALACHNRATTDTDRAAACLVVFVDWFKNGNFSGICYHFFHYCLSSPWLGSEKLSA